MSKTTMTLEEFRDCLDRYGDDPARWPDAAAARALLEESDAARAALDEMRRLRAAFSASAGSPRAPAGLADRIARRAALEAPAAGLGRMPARTAAAAKRRGPDTDARQRAGGPIWILRDLANRFGGTRVVATLMLFFVLGFALRYLDASQTDTLLTYRSVPTFFSVFDLS
ncbi:hypothetical protein [Polymorphum gilvum]|nr:hypothetical protein [Polymorphum gilvum]